ncbi:Golgi to ER traffic protein 4 [Fulvia fulva]|nr:Golgi to ER traffic protein 4 [Fulvia fulva]KAK4623146.1 Golgi to ER traffic protein 4 [Fulvia fulva]WPV16448.1 Golgi to ER traffic protein 4 [Fulvia fulva]WPV31265.1 Golgi to ER traffic protein 4 [Fulvia fulva]
MSAAKIQKVLARQQAKIEEGDFYEAHQQLRTIANRYAKSQDWPAAADLLSNGALMLLKAGQGGSGSDLCTYLMEVYQKAEFKADVPNKARILSLLRAFPPDEPSKKKFVTGIVEWSAKHSDFPAGDPELHHVIGSLYAEEGETYDAERHLTLGTSDSASALADMEYEWYASDEPSTASHYAARAVFPYLLIGNTRAANKALLLFTSRLSSLHPGLGVQSISSPSSDIRIYPSLPLLNFLGLLLLAIQRGTKDLFNQLKTHYAAHLKEAPQWDEPLLQVGEMYFGIKIPSQSNPLFDMMSSMLMGGSNPFAAKKKESRQVTAGNATPSTSETPAPAPAVD